MEEIEQEKADRLTRLGSLLIDIVILCIIVVPIGYLVGVFDGLSQEPPVEPPLPLALFMLVVNLAVYAAVNWSLLEKNGQTIGKKFNGIKIVKTDGSKPSRNDLIFKRYFAYIVIPMLPVIGQLLSLIGNLMIFGKQRRCLHDHIAGTKVVKG